VDDIRRTGWWAISKVYRSSGGQMLGDGQMVSRSVFLSWIGLGLGSTLFGTMVFGFRNKYKYQVKKNAAYNLPICLKAFDGLKLVQISDVHSGSLQDVNAGVNKGIDLILKQNPDIIFFTGDLVNDRATELDYRLNLLLQGLKAPIGSI
jgi:predicted MPP superfamily phosphohydrolase